MRKTRKRAQATPRDDAAQLRLIADNMPAMSIAYDEKLLCLFASQRFAEFFGFTTTSIVGKHLREIIGEGPYQEVKPHFDRVLEGKRTAYQRTRVLDSGDPRYLEVELTPNIGPDGRTRGLFAVTTDVTDHKVTEKAMRDSEAELRLLTDNVPAMISYIDRQMNCVFANKRYADFFGLAAADVVGKPLREIVGAAHFAALQAHFANALEGHPVSFQWDVQRVGGALRCIEVKLVPRASDQGPVSGCYAMAIYITEQKRTEERIQHVAEHDSLTGLPNRLLFNDRLSQALSIAKRDAGQCALLYLDLDKFKPINDTLGHAAGDQLLRMVAGRIREQVRESDTVARVGGDEFTVILHDISSPQNAATVAQKIIAALAAPFQLGSGSRESVVGSSIGIAVYPKDGQDHETLIKKADAAMYLAKARGNSFCFSGT